MLAAAAQAGRSVRITAGATKLEWGKPMPGTDVELSTAGLDHLVAHDEGDLTAVLGAGMKLADAQEAFGAAGQMLALDPPHAAAATVGGVVATGDSGPMRHRHGAVRDLILGITVGLPDGNLVRAGGRVIKNVAGYDLAKLFSGAYGTLGVIVEVVLRLHPRPASTATTIGRTSTPAALARAAGVLARAPLELLSLDVAWQDGRGAVLARAAGSAARAAADTARRALRDEGAEVELIDDDEPLWREQRAVQRAGDAGTVVMISALPAQLARTIELADETGARLVGRAALGISWLALPPGEVAAIAATVDGMRRKLAPGTCTVLDAPREVRAALDPWGVPEGPELVLARRLKARFDPRGTCNPGLFVGGI